VHGILLGMAFLAPFFVTFFEAILSGGSTPCSVVVVQLRSNCAAKGQDSLHPQCLCIATWAPALIGDIIHRVQ
jgi:hypothetical protein